jgi:nanoRNase/pAp phosphatase (c-di-AMP/oligoRNAs hydrolase)
MEELFRKLLSECKGKRIAIASHLNMDSDGLACAYALSCIIPDSVICFTDKLNHGSGLLAEKLGIKTVSLESIDRNAFDAMVVVDTSSSTLLPAAKKWNVLAIMDHHQQEGRDINGKYMFIDSNAASTAEIMEYLVPNQFWKTEKSGSVAYALAVAIISDGARFKSARQQSFAALARLMDMCRKPYEELLSVAEPEPKEEAKIAMLKAMQRLQYLYAAGCFIVTSEVGSNESDASSLLAEAGDVAFVASWKDKEQETRISARARPYVKVPLNEVMKEVAVHFGGDGGGHKKAAGAYVKVHTKEALEKCIDVFVRKAGG